MNRNVARQNRSASNPNTLQSKLADTQIEEAYELNYALDVVDAIGLLRGLQAVKEDVLLLAPRFLTHVDTENRPYPTSCKRYGPCLLWTGATDKNGYAVMRAGKKRQASHVAWYLAYGVLPEYLCHVCDNRRCVAIKHLIEADAAFNAYDREIKKRGGFIVNPNAPDTFQEQPIDTLLTRHNEAVEIGPPRPSFPLRVSGPVCASP
jgi:hypothetical protein